MIELNAIYTNHWHKKHYLYFTVNVDGVDVHCDLIKIEYSYKDTEYILNTHGKSLDGIDAYTVIRNSDGLSEEDMETQSTNMITTPTGKRILEFMKDKFIK
jgi:hypothetical protein